MGMVRRIGWVTGTVFLALLWTSLPADADPPVETSPVPVRVATYNVENYLVMDRLVEGRWRPQFPKPEEEKEAVWQVIERVRPDLLVLQEMGPAPLLEELRENLRQRGLDYPYGEVLPAVDEVRHIAFLSRHRPVAVYHWTDLDFAYFDEREKVKRGLLEVVFETGGNRWSVYTLHLKSKWTERPDDPQAEVRRVREAEAIRNHILDRRDPERDFFLIAGDVNDSLHSSALRRLRQRGEVTISHPLPAVDSRGHTWTHRWQRAAQYGRIDYLLVSPAIKPLVVPGSYRIDDGPGWDLASDHRLLYVDLLFPAR